MSDRGLWELDASALAELVRSHEASPREVVAAHLERIAETNDALRAFIHVCAEEALAAARAAERVTTPGPLHGVPVGHKDIFHVRGLPTTGGSRSMAGVVAAEDATVVARLRAAGAICLGKLNTSELAAGSMEVYGEARNPWNLDLTTGGSSAGSAGAVAARLLPLASGSDTGGSIRIPSSFCGVVGLKPTYGRVSRDGIVPLSWSLDHAGPIARSVRDVALALGVVAGRDPRDPTTRDVPVPDYAAAVGRSISGVRIGVPREFFFDDVDPEVAAAVRAAGEELGRGGAVLVPCDVAHLAWSSAASWAINYTEAFTVHRAGVLARPTAYTASFRHKVAVGACLTAEERLTGDRARQAVTAGLVGALRDVEVLLAPATPYPAYPIDGALKTLDRGRLTRPANLAGLPALGLPCGLTRDGLPIGLQLIGRAWDEPTLLTVGAAWLALAGPLPAPPLLARGVPSRAEPPGRPPADLGADWVSDVARSLGLTFISEADAPVVAGLLGPLKRELAAVRAAIDPAVEPPVRPAPDAR